MAEQFHRNLHTFDGEHFKEIPGYPGYYAGLSGNVASCKQWNGDRVDFRILKQWETPKGYRYVNLYKQSESASRGQQRTECVHRLVTLAWIGTPPEGYEVNHRDLNKHNNSLSNLEYCTRRENVQHAMRARKDRQEQQRAAA